MSGPFIAIQSDGVSLKQQRGFLEIKRFKNEEASGPMRVPIDSIEGVLIEAKGVNLTKSAILALTEQGIPIILTDRNHRPLASVCSYSGHHRSSEILDVQIEASLPRKKAIWKAIVQAKIKNQDAVLREARDKTVLQHLAARVKSGDSDNREGVAARLYWSALFGGGFVRNPNANGLNGMLNFGYAIIRSAFSKEIALHGLHPGIGVHHRSGRNAFRLVDDLMEPYRPLVDYVAFLAVDKGIVEVSKHTKHLMLQLCYEPIFHDQGWGRSVSSAIRLSVRSYLERLKDGKGGYVAVPKVLMGEIFKLGHRGILTR